jgi:hypothetical protein
MAKKCKLILFNEDGSVFQEYDFEGDYTYTHDTIYSESLSMTGIRNDWMVWEEGDPEPTLETMLDFHKKQQIIYLKNELDQNIKAVYSDIFKSKEEIEQEEQTLMNEFWTKRDGIMATQSLKELREYLGLRSELDKELEQGVPELQTDI